MNSTQRLFYIPHLLERWEGYSQCYGFSGSPLSIAVFVHLQELNATTSYIRSSLFPSRLHLLLYVVDVTEKPDCLIIRQSKNGTCQMKSVYPINRLRNIAIKDVATSHFILFDMDVWPSCFNSDYK